ncbi:MAG TPA: hypothetical protein PK095_21520 [Myxococcota bacterium]|nr:hypothetical protein [Myxococcota bacterium]
MSRRRGTTHVAVLSRRSPLQPQPLAAVGLGHAMVAHLESEELTLGLGLDPGAGRVPLEDLLGRVGRALRLAELADGLVEDLPTRTTTGEPTVEQRLTALHMELQVLSLGAEPPEHRFERYLDAITDAVGERAGAELGPLVVELCASLSQGIRDLEIAIEDDDVNRIGRVLQRLKPSLKLVGEASLAEAVYTIERCARLVRSVHEGLEPGTGIDTTLAHLWRESSCTKRSASARGSFSPRSASAILRAMPSASSWFNQSSVAMSGQEDRVASSRARRPRGRYSLSRALAKS